jgi:hypothetical protein
MKGIKIVFYGNDDVTNLLNCETWVAHFLYD